MSLAKLYDIVEKEENTSNRIEQLKYDIEFHSMLYNISGNETIRRFQKMLMPIFDYVDSGLHLPSQSQDDNFVSHRVLVNVLKKGTPEEFRNKMHNHLSNYFQKIEKLSWQNSYVRNS